MKKKIFFIVVLLGLLLAMGCNGEEADEEIENNGIEFIDEIVSAGENPPKPEDVGADYIDPVERDTIQGLDLAAFVSDWNEAAEKLDMDKLIIEEIEVRYAKPAMNFTIEFFDWLIMSGSIDYETGYLDFPGIEWDITEQTDGFILVNSWAAFIYATNLEVTTEDDLMAVIEELNIFELSEEEIVDYHLEQEIDDLLYDFYSTETFGMLEVLSQ